jgi:oligoribonuclease (3'-5' exoribonuclease)
MLESGKFVSIDIETLGLGLEAPIIEVGMVVADWVKQEVLGTYHTYVTHYLYNKCEPFAMSMHPTILRRIADRDPEFSYVDIYHLGESMVSFLNTHIDGKVLWAGKNVAGFDIPRLERQADIGRHIEYHHRMLDPGMLYWNPLTDEKPPSQSECLSRAGFHNDVRHEALADAMDVVQLIFHHKNKFTNPCAEISCK